MKQILLFTALFSVGILSSGCKSRLFTYGVDVKIASTYTIDQTGNFSQDNTLTSADVAKALNLPSGARVKKLDIESLSIMVKFNTQNEALAMRASGAIRGVNDVQPVSMFSDYLIPLAGGSAAQFALNELLDAGIDKLKNNLQDIARDLGTNRFHTVTLQFSGASNPAGRRMVADLSFDIKANVTYERCESIPWSDVGDECPETVSGP